MIVKLNNKSKEVIEAVESALRELREDIYWDMKTGFDTTEIAKIGHPKEILVRGTITFTIYTDCVVREG